MKEVNAGVGKHNKITYYIVHVWKDDIFINL